MAKKTLADSYLHSNEKRSFIPSSEEAGMEINNENVISKNKKIFPKNPVVSRGQDPELFWLGKYGNDDNENLLNVDIRSLYRHEHISPELLIKNFYKFVENGSGNLSLSELFGNSYSIEEIEKPKEYYKHSENWKNRIIQGDSLLVMTSLLEREGLAGKVQTIYIDPPYGIKYGSNWQIKINNRNVQDGRDDSLTGEPEQIKAFRDTWELGIHSYLSYLRDRLLVAKELLNDSGSCFVQISDENVHLVRCILDEVFGSENFVSLITYKKTTGNRSVLIDNINDYLIWYSKDKNNCKYRRLFEQKKRIQDVDNKYYLDNEENKNFDRITLKEAIEKNLVEKLFYTERLTSQSKGGEQSDKPLIIENKTFFPGNSFWRTTPEGFEFLKKQKRLFIESNTLLRKVYLSDFGYSRIPNLWDDILGASNLKYVVQTSTKAIQRCLLMTTDPGDLVLDPTCGSGTTAFVSELWGRRWITIDTSRIAINIAKTRLMTALYPYYYLNSDVLTAIEQKEGKINKKIEYIPLEERISDVRQGFIYEEVPHITLKSLANDEPPETELLYDKPYTDKSRLRVSGPFTFETLQNFEPVSPEELEKQESTDFESSAKFEETIKQQLLSSGIKNGLKNETVVFERIEKLANPYLHAIGFYKSNQAAYIYIGPKFGTVPKKAVDEAVKECRKAGDVNWLVILGFSFESDIENKSVTQNVGSFEVTKVRMHDDLLQDGLLKKDRKTASFVTIGEPDILIEKQGGKATVTIKGVDIYDPIQDVIKSRDAADIAYWMLDDDYDGSNFIVKQIYFSGSESKDEFKKWKKELTELANKTKKRAERLLKIEIDEEAFSKVYGLVSRPIEIKENHRIALRVVSQFGEETTKVLWLKQ